MKDYTNEVLELCENRMLGFESTQEDAQLIANVINILTNEDKMSISRAQGILLDAIKLIPHLGSV